MHEMLGKLPQLEAAFGAMSPQFAKAGMEIAQDIRRYYAGLSDPTRPVGIFLLLGTTAQNPLPEVVARHLYDGVPFYIDMGLYRDAESASAFRDYLSAVAGSPQCKVLVFSDIDKANTSVRAVLSSRFNNAHLPDLPLTDRILFMTCELQPPQVLEKAAQADLIHKLIYSVFDHSFIDPIDLLFQFYSP